MDACQEINELIRERERERSCLRLDSDARSRQSVSSSGGHLVSSKLVSWLAVVRLKIKLAGICIIAQCIVFELPQNF